LTKDIFNFFALTAFNSIDIKYQFFQYDFKINKIINCFHINAILLQRFIRG
jgi:hypothetical protein